MNRPLFCPRQGCLNHRSRHPHPGWYRAAGSYYTDAFGDVPRFQCTRCGKYFSTQTFSIDYYSKRTLSYQRLLRHLITTSSIRDMARDFSVSVDVVLNKLSRLARNCLAVLQYLQREVKLSEHLVADGLESYTVSQFFPCHINLLVGKSSQLVYWIDYVTLRRKGRMTDEQRHRREVLERLFRADPKGVERSFRELYTQVAYLISDGVKPRVGLVTDEHPAYGRAERGHFCVKGMRKQHRFGRVTVSSKLPRTRFNPLFSVNYLDRQVRKDMAEHVRETVCFGRNVSCALDRLAVYLVYHNMQKPYRESQGDMRSHAEVAGVPEKSVKSLCYGLYTRRAFFSKVKFEGTYRKMWQREYVTPLKRRQEYRPLHIAG